MMLLSYYLFCSAFSAFVFVSHLRPTALELKVNFLKILNYNVGIPALLLYWKKFTLRSQQMHVARSTPMLKMKENNTTEGMMVIMSEFAILETTYDFHIPVFQ